ncbi:MAG: helix-turn-helix domain-containing protein [Nanoarchaeota archaeon]|nr:helix-turn-helix domain-containing protein [Nanoarchaeota archaeon]
MESYINKEEKVMEVLRFIGFHRNETLIYLDLLKSGPSTAVDISRRTKIHRPNTYDALRKLVERGFVSQTRTSIKNLFHAIEAFKIKDYIRQKEREFDELIPYLGELSKNTTEKEDVNVSKGAFAVRQAALSLIDIGKEIKAWGAPKESVDTFGAGFLKEFHMKRAAKKIMMKQIYNADSIERIKYLNKFKHTEARYLPKDYDTPVSTVVCGDTVMMLIFNSNPPSVISIRRQEIADAYDNYFKILWARARKP